MPSLHRESTDSLITVKVRVRAGIAFSRLELKLSN